ncbi:DUS12 phosphatase, partial [Polyodon spathula]|nr:dual specificity protein phosphatase 12 [Polyodon spathula]MBN3284335.1 DUS12 phosphatase [Polyodon spathula]
MICVQSGVYIGGASDLTDCKNLTDAAITHILTVDSEEPEVLGSFQRKFIYALDESSSDLLSILDDCVQFITEALTTTPAAVLVHCHAGVSRSAAVVTAFMMKTHSLNLSDAYVKLQNIKPDVKIIEEFLDQLELYETMGCKVDETSPVYKQYRLRKVTEKYPELKNLPREVFAADPTSPGQTQSSEAICRCRKCRRALFRSSSILNHTPGTGPAAFAHKKFSHLTAVCGDQSQCTSHFIEPVQWMEQALLGVLDGQLLCPKCSSKLGSFNWFGEQCSCGRWVTPAFQIHKNRVDEIKHLQIPGLRRENS